MRSALPSDIKTNTNIIAEDILTIDNIDVKYVSFSINDSINNTNPALIIPTLLTFLYSVEEVGKYTVAFNLKKINKSTGIYDNILYNHYEYEPTPTITCVCGVVGSYKYYFTAICIPSINKIIIYYVINDVVRNQVIPFVSGNEDSTITFSSGTIIHRASYYSDNNNYFYTFSVYVYSDSNGSFTLDKVYNLPFN
jgi:hypothetical protein